MPGDQCERTGQTAASRAGRGGAGASCPKAGAPAAASLLTSVSLVAARSDLPWVQGSIRVLGPRESLAFSETDLDSCLISTIIAVVLMC